MITSIYIVNADVLRNSPHVMFSGYSLTLFDLEHHYFTIFLVAIDRIQLALSNPCADSLDVTRSGGNFPVDCPLFTDAPNFKGRMKQKVNHDTMHMNVRSLISHAV